MYIKKLDLKRVLLALALQFAAMFMPAASVSRAAQIDSDNSPSPYYSFTVIAKTGDAVGAATLQSIGKGVSINDSGTVAFVAQLDTGSKGIFVGDGSTPLHYVNPGFYNLDYGDSVQINNRNIIVARDRQGSGRPGVIRRWDGKQTNKYETVAEPNRLFDSVDAYPSINNSDDVVFNATRGNDNLLATRKPLARSDEYNVLKLPPGTALSPRPMIADDLDKHIVTRYGDSILLYKYNLTTSEPIAATGRFWSAVGRSPGISDDGRIVVFVGDLTEDGAKTFKTTAGPGVFARVEEKSGVGRIVRIAGKADSDDKVDAWEIWNDANHNNQVDAGEVSGFTSFDLDARVGVNSTYRDEPFTDKNDNGIRDPEESFEDKNNNSRFDPGQRAVTVVYVALDSTGKKGIYTSRLNFVGNPKAPFDPDSPWQLPVGFPINVITQGQMIGGISGTVQDLNLYDPINNRDRGDVAFWMRTTSNVQAVIRARYQEVIYIDFDPVHNYQPSPGLTAQLKRLGVREAWGGSIATLLSNRTDLVNDVESIKNNIVDLVQLVVRLFNF